MAVIPGQLEKAQLENLSSDPTNLPEGRVWSNTTSDRAKIVLGGVAKEVLTTDQAQAVTNKSIDADLNTITNIDNADIKAGAAIDRAKLASGTNNHVIINNGSGVLSSEATLAKSRGGSGQDNSSLTFPSTGTLGTLAGTEQLTNKDYEGGTASNTSRITVPKAAKATLDGLTRKEATVVYATDQSKLFYDNGSQLKEIGSGSGTGGLNFITNSDAESDTTGWSTYKDAVAVTPADGTGGSPSLTFARTTTANRILTGAASFEITSPNLANTQGEGASFDFVVPLQYTQVSKRLFVSFDYKNGFWADADMFRVYVYNVDTSTLITVQDVSNSSGVLVSTTNPSRYVGYFETSASATAANYRLIVHCSSARTDLFTLGLDQVKVSPDATVPGAIITDLGTEAWTVANGTATSSVKIHREGRKVKINGVVTFTGTATGLIGLTIPAAYAPSATDYTSLGTVNLFAGDARFIDSGTLSGLGAALLTSSTNLSFLATNAAGTYSTAVPTSATVPFTWGSTDQVFFQAEWTVSSWVASTALSTTETMLMSAKFTGTKSALQTISSTAATKVTWSATTDNINAYDSTNNRYVVKRKGRYIVDCLIALANASAEFYYVYIYVNGAVVRRFYPGSATNPAYQIVASLDLNANDYIEIFAQSTADTSYDVKATATANDIYFSVTEQPDLTIFSVYGSSDFTESTNTTLASWPITASQWGDFTNITLQPGEWDLVGTVVTNNNGAVTTGTIGIGISTTSGNSTTGLDVATNRMLLTNVGTSGYAYTLSIPRYRVVVTTATTYYLKGIYGAAITNFQYQGYAISARRIK